VFAMDNAIILLLMIVFKQANITSQPTNMTFNSAQRDTKTVAKVAMIPMYILALISTKGLCASMVLNFAAQHVTMLRHINVCIPLELMCALWDILLCAMEVVIRRSSLAQQTPPLYHVAQIHPNAWAVINLARVPCLVVKLFLFGSQERGGTAMILQRVYAPVAQFTIPTIQSNIFAQVMLQFVARVLADVSLRPSNAATSTLVGILGCAHPAQHVVASTILLKPSAAHLGLHAKAIPPPQPLIVHSVQFVF